MIDVRLDEIFSSLAAEQPDAVAICEAGQQLSYAEIERRAETLARKLRSAGATPGNAIAFSLPRSTDALVTMLGILKAGCAYVPLDPKLPRARFDLLLQTVGAPLLVTQEALVETEWSRSAHDTEPILEKAAYILFTSGSTGVPKAVVVPHRAVAARLHGVDYVTLNANTRFLQLAPLSFDASTLEIWGPLLNGSTVVLCPEDLPDFSTLGRTIDDYGVTGAWLTASLFNQVVDADVGILRPLRELFTGGEALSVPHVVRALEALPETAIVNGYGPTETTIFAATFRVPRHFDEESRRVPIGRPLPETQVYVLDEQGELAPFGVGGEIFVGGAGLALGYFGDEDLTAEKFVSDNIGDDSEARLYRTGDRGMMLPDGNLDFLGRQDRQVKIRGFRIEPGEIESVLARHPAVRQVAVRDWDDSGTRALAAYVVADGAESSDDLRRFLRERLPSHMVPAYIVMLERLPLTPAGKVDLQALPPPNSASARSSAWRVPARTPTEEVLIGLWANALRLEKMGIHDDFFELGGHSLLALQLIHATNRAFGLDLPVRLFFTKPTVAGQAEEIDRAQSVAGEARPEFPPLVPLRVGGSKLPFFLVAGGWGGEAELIVYAGLVRYLDKDQPIYGLRIRGVDDIVEPYETVQEIAAEHVREIRKVQPQGPYFVGGSCVGGVVAFEIAQQLRRSGETVASLLLIDSGYPSWTRILRNRARLLWQRESLPLLRGVAEGPRRLKTVLRERLEALMARSSDLKLARLRRRIAWRYLRTILSYSPQAYPGAISLIVCEKHRTRNPTWRWRDLARDGLEVHYVPGDHFTHLRDHVAATAASIDNCLEAARRLRTENAR